MNTKLDFYLFNIQESELLDEAGFISKPRGWSDNSVKKAGTTLARHVGKETPKDKGFFEKCVAKMTGKVKNPQGYCAAMKDEAHGSTYWRGKEKTKKQAQQQIRRNQNV
jgi:hypothetical protein